jgi:hypothetical protein
MTLSGDFELEPHPDANNIESPPSRTRQSKPDAAP